MGEGNKSMFFIISTSIYIYIYSTSYLGLLDIGYKRSISSSASLAHCSILVTAEADLGRSVGEWFLPSHAEAEDILESGGKIGGGGGGEGGEATLISLKIERGCF